MSTTYDKVAYPSVLFKRTQPERLAVVAALHGLTPPDVATARVLEIRCGEELNKEGRQRSAPCRRMIDSILTNTMLPELSIELLNRQLCGDEVKEIAVAVEGDGFGCRFG